MYKILFVEDDLNYARALEKVFKQNQYDVVSVDTPVSAIAEVAKESYDLVVSDYMMPQMNGIKLITMLKEIDNNLKSILLTGFSEEEVELEALDINVDAFLCKDKSTTIIMKYVESLLEKSGYAQQYGQQRLTSKEENLMIDNVKHEVFKNGELVIDITSKEYGMLVMFLENKGVALSREKIAEALWTTDIEEIDLRVIDGHIKRLRKKLRLFSIVSVRGYGYKWNE